MCKAESLPSRGPWFAKTQEWISQPRLFSSSVALGPARQRVGPIRSASRHAIPVARYFRPFRSLALPCFSPYLLQQPYRPGLIQFQNIAGLKCWAFFRVSYLLALPLDTALFDETADIASGTV